MVDFISQNFDFCVYLLVSLLSVLFVFFRTRSLSKTLKYIKEEFCVKYKTVDTKKEVSQEFSETIPDYVLDPSTNELERLPVDKNVQVLIQSYIDSALERALERFINVHDKEDLEMPAIEFERSRRDLADLADAMEIAEEYRDRFNLPDSASYADIYAEVDKYAQHMKQKINEQEVKNNGKVQETSSQSTEEHA